MRTVAQVPERTGTATLECVTEAMRAERILRKETDEPLLRVSEMRASGEDAIGARSKVGRLETQRRKSCKEEQLKPAEQRKITEAVDFFRAAGGPGLQSAA